MNYVLLKEDVLSKNYEIIKELCLHIKNAVKNHKEEIVAQIKITNFFEIRYVVSFSEIKNPFAVFWKSNITSSKVDQFHNKIIITFYFSKWEKENIPFDIVIFFYILHYRDFFNAIYKNKKIQKNPIIILPEIVYFLLFSFYFFQKVYKFSVDIKRIFPYLKNITTIIDNFLNQEIGIYDFLKDLNILENLAKSNVIKNSFLKLIFIGLNKTVSPFLNEILSFYELNKSLIDKYSNELINIIKKVNNRAQKNVQKYFAYANRISKEVA